MGRVATGQMSPATSPPARPGRVRARSPAQNPHGSLFLPQASCAMSVHFFARKNELTPRVFGTRFARFTLPDKVTAILAEKTSWRSHPTTRSLDLNSRDSSTSTSYCHSLTDSTTSAASVTKQATANSTSTIIRLILLFLLNPVLRSFRALQQASLLERVRRKVGCSRTSLGSLSEAVEVFDPQRLEAIIAELWAEVPPSRGVGQHHVHQVLTAVNGSVVKTLASLAEAAYLRDKNGNTHCGWRFHTQFDIDRSLPTRIEVTSALNGGKTDEKHVLRRSLQPDHCYVLDRWYAEFALFNDIVKVGSSYVCRIRDNSNLDEVVEERPVSAAAGRAGVLRDVVVKLGTSHKAAARPDHPAKSRQKVGVRSSFPPSRPTAAAARSGRSGGRPRLGPLGAGVRRPASDGPSPAPDGRGGAERVSGTHPERVSGTHVLLEDGRSGQVRQTVAHSDFRFFLLFIDSRKR